MSGELFDGEIPFGCMDSEHFMALRNNFILVNASDAVEVSFAKIVSSNIIKIYLNKI